MDRLRTMIRALLFLVCIVFGSAVDAETIAASGGTTYPATVGASTWVASGGGTGADTNTACKTMGNDAAASVGATYAPGTCPSTSVVVDFSASILLSGQTYTCKWVKKDHCAGNTFFNYGTATYGPTYTCPNGGTLSGTNCVVPYTCPAGQGYTLQGSNCVRCDPLPGEQRNPDGSCGCPSSGAMIGDQSTTLTFTPPATVTGTRVCFGFCQYDADGCIKGYLAGTLKGTECYGPLRSAGQSCNPSTFGGGAVDPSLPTPIAPNKPGYCWGQIDGKDVQLPCDKTTSTNGTNTPDKSTTTNPDGTSKEVTEKTDTTTTCDGEKCKTTQTTTETTTTKDAAGNPTGTTTTVSTKELNPQDSELGQFCQQNPKASVCLTSKWAGTCAAGFTCDGDAVQCAVARETFTRNCSMFALNTTGAGSADADAYWAQNSKGEGLTRAGNGSLFPAVQTAPTFDTSSRSLSGGALVDQCFTVAGTQFCIPWSKLNAVFGWIGAGMLLVSLLIASRIYANAILSQGT